METIINAFENLMDLVYQRENNESDRILTNLCMVGPAPENWFKFELFSQLCNLRGGKIKDVYTEYKFHDIVIFIDNNQICAVELKILANWWTPDKYVLRITRDFEKIRNSNNVSTGYALLITIFTDPIQGKVEWMEKQLDSTNGIKSVESFYSKINQLTDSGNNEPGAKLASINIQNEIFNSLILSGFLYKAK